MDLMITLAKDNQANKTSIITRLVMEQQGNLQVHKEAPAQGGQVKVNTLSMPFWRLRPHIRYSKCYLKCLRSHNINTTILFLFSSGHQYWGNSALTSTQLW